MSCFTLRYNMDIYIYMSTKLGEEANLGVHNHNNNIFITLSLGYQLDTLRDAASLKTLPGKPSETKP
ncbi:hypothetical protein HanIR_Chr04g0177061 [Helianthus annuus]|nr:hypothetical protein HanIR_Chr04g0177061 [Helianthus annuus]